MNAGQNALNLWSHIWFLLTYGSHLVSTALPLSVFKDTYVALIVAFKQNPTTFFTEERGSIEFVDQ